LSREPLRPGATLGIIGGGQLARMLAIEARRHELRVLVQDPDPEGPAAQVADGVFAGAWNDAPCAQRMAKECQVVTVDNEHVPSSLLASLESITSVRPASSVLGVIQDRLQQRQFLARLGLAQPAFAAVSGPHDLAARATELGLSCVLKSRFEGYDGRGQARITGPTDVSAAAHLPFIGSSVLEAFIDFRCELSIVMARAVDGSTAYYPLVENVHRRGTLLFSHAPSTFGSTLQHEAERVAGAIALALGHVGVLAVEFFLTHDGQLLVNEVAPRTHNSGHFTLGACETSQFEQHLRAIAGWQLGSARQHTSAAMLNLYGDSWEPTPPPWPELLNAPGAHLHLYGKRAARPGRKMGHVLFLDAAPAASSALARAHALHARLSNSDAPPKGG
jgi:5-(carboxyamino)imidazole ribonucleotide synthase